MWGKLSNVLQSVTIIQRPEAVNIHDMVNNKDENNFLMKIREKLHVK